MQDVLRLPPAEICAMQDARLRRMVALCRERHPYYSAAWRGLDLDAVQGVADLWRLPLTPKSALMEAPERFRLDCTGLPVAERALWEVVHTTGSTGDPTPIYMTTHDWQGYVLLNRRVAEISGITERDVIANLFPLTAAAMGAFVRATSLAYGAGAAVCAAMPGAPVGTFGIQRSMDEAIRMVERHRATVLTGVTSFVRRVLLRALELGADFGSVRMCAVTGEASTPALRADMRALMRQLGTAGATIFDRYGSTEGGGLSQCTEEFDWHNPAPDLVLHEVVDPATGRSLADGERGHLAVSHLDRRGTVLLRYLVGDVVSLDRSACPHCGRTAERIVGPVVRTKDLVKVKGMLVNPALLLARLQAVPGISEFQVLVARPGGDLGMDELVVRLAPHPGVDAAALEAEVVAAAQGAVGVRPRVVLEAARAIYDPEQQAKATRFVDTR